jgi:hypothetical protein
MKLIFRLGMVLWVVLAGSYVSASGDFGWMRDFNIRAEADPMDFRARLEARFRIGNTEINAVLRHAGNPADGYVLFRLGEIAGQPIERVVERYEAYKGKGWGVLAKSLGIKPGSKEFHALKQHQDLYGENGGGKSKGRGNGKGKKPKS